MSIRVHWRLSFTLNWTILPHRHVPPGGIFSMVDIAAGSRHADNLDHPLAPFLYTVSLLHCLPVGRVDGGAGLGMMWGRERALDLLRQAGFTQVEVQTMSHDPFNDHYLCRKGSNRP
ncbi:hypothetical protein [Desulfacinum infernum]|nr:hypothetical protein [Desulfacinum infernum]